MTGEPLRDGEVRVVIPPKSPIRFSLRCVFEEPDPEAPGTMLRVYENISVHEDMRTSWGGGIASNHEPFGFSSVGDASGLLAGIGVILMQVPDALVFVPRVAAHPMAQSAIARARVEQIRASDVAALAEKVATKNGAGHMVAWLTKATAELARRMPLVTSLEDTEHPAGQPVGADLALADFIEPMGKTGAGFAARLRKSSNSGSSWLAWQPDKSGILPGLVTLARAGWLDVVKPQIEREADERKRQDVPFRFPQPVGKAFSSDRVATIKSRRKNLAPDERWGGWTNCVTLAIPGAQLALPLPLDVKIDDGGTLQSVLTGGLLRTYIATWALWADQRSLLVEGGFTWDEEAVIRRYLKKTGKVDGHLREEVRADLARLCEFKVVKAGSWNVQNGSEALISAYREDGSGRTIYKHAGVISLFLNDNFAQVPRDVLSLPPDDVPLALGLSTVARQLASAMLMNENRHEGTLRQLAEACGADVKAGLRKYGPTAYWTRIRDALVRVADGGKVGRVEMVDPTGIPAENTRVRLTMSESMVAAYQPLVARVSKRRATEKVLAAKGKKLPRLVALGRREVGGTRREVGGTRREVGGTRREVGGRPDQARSCINTAVEPSFRGRPRPDPIQLNPS